MTVVLAQCHFLIVFFLSQWETLSTVPLPEDLITAVRAVVHDNQVFLFVSSEKSGTYFIRSSDLVTWQRLEAPSGVVHGCGMVSLGHSLYFLTPHQDETNTRIYRLADSYRCSSETSPWIQLQPACPSAQQFPARPGVGHRIITAGGRHQNISTTTVVEYNVEKQCWLTVGLPALPEPAQQQHAAILDDNLHLLGGLSHVQDGQLSDRQSVSVFSIEIKAGRLSGDWHRKLPPTPHVTCGACRVFDTIVVAGGGTSRTRRYSSAVHVLDSEKERWLSLPSLRTPRGQPSLIYFKGKLLAIGGANDNISPKYWLPVVEYMTVSPALQ